MEDVRDAKIELEITPKKEEDMEQNSVTETAKAAAEVFAGIEAEKIETEYLEIDITKYVDGTNEGGISDMGTPLEIALKYDTSKVGNPIVVRTHNGKAKVFERLGNKSAGTHRDATYYVGDGILYLYSQYFSDFALVYATQKTYYVSIDTGVGEPILQIVGADQRKLRRRKIQNGFKYKRF